MITKFIVILEGKFSVNLAFAKHCYLLDLFKMPSSRIYTLQTLEEGLCHHTSCWHDFCCCCCNCLLLLS